jgi:hypothetical protein
MPFTMQIKSKRRLLTCFVAAIACAAMPIFAQDQQAVPRQRPQIGLVLEGGAPLGLAHIGVIKWLEEHHIPVRHVAGTSMGGLIGGLYSTGNSPAAMQELMQGIDWNSVLKGQIPFEDLTYRRKQDDRDYPNSLEFGLRHGVQFPAGFNSGRQVGLILDPLGVAQHRFISPQGFVGENFLPLYSNNNIIAEYQNQLFGGAFDVGYQFGRTSELRVGYEAAHRKVFPQIGSVSDLPSVDGRIGATRLRYSLIDTDDPVIPRNGVNLAFRTEWFDTAPGATEAFPLAENQMTVFKRISQPSSILFSAYGGTTFGHDHVGVPVFSLGGTHALAAYGTNELLTNQYFYFKAGYLRQLARLPALIGDSLYFYTSYEIAKTYGEPMAPSLPVDGVAAVVVNTFIGPILFGGSVGNNDHHKIFFQIGRLF